MLWSVILLALLLAAVTTQLLCRRCELRAAARDLCRLTHSDTNQKLRLASPNKDLEKLLIQVNALLQQKQEADIRHRQTERELRAQIANVSHDLRTPLTSILGYLQLLKEQPCTHQEQEEYLAVVRARAQTLQVLISGFYDLSRLDAGGYLFERQPVQLEQVLCELVAAFYPDLSQRQIEPDLAIESELPAVCADIQAVRRIYTNLMQNALKHGCGPLHIAVRRSGRRVVTHFTNRAPDLAASDIPRLFDRFFTADRMRTGSNTGLGLAIVQKLAQQMGATAKASLQGDLLTISLIWPAPAPGNGK